MSQGQWELWKALHREVIASFWHLGRDTSKGWGVGGYRQKSVVYRVRSNKNPQHSMLRVEN